jgi:ABC-type Fe3+ transport system substrate-binding protein
VRDEVAWGWLSKLRIEGHRLRRTVAVISLARFQPAATRAFLEFVLGRRGQLQQMAEGHPRGDEIKPGGEKVDRVEKPEPKAEKPANRRK